MAEQDERSEETPPQLDPSDDEQVEAHRHHMTDEPRDEAEGDVESHRHR